MTQETNNLVKSLSSPSSATKSKQIIKTDNNKGTDGEKRKSRSHRVQHKPEFMTRVSDDFFFILFMINFFCVYSLIADFNFYIDCHSTTSTDDE